MDLLVQGWITTMISSSGTTLIMAETLGMRPVCILLKLCHKKSCIPIPYKVKTASFIYCIADNTKEYI